MGRKTYKVEYLSADSFDQWNDFVDKSPQGSIYCKTWWLDVVAPKKYDILTVFKGDHLCGGIPLVYDSAKDEKAYCMPQFTKTLGIVLRDIEGKYVNIISEQRRIIELIVEAIGDPSSFVQNFHHNFNNWMPFLWQGFNQTTRYYYILKDIKKTQKIWDGFASDMRKTIRKAEANGFEVVVGELGIDVFWEICLKTFKRQNMQMPLQYDLFVKLDDVLQQLNKRFIIFVLDKKSNPIHAFYSLIDNEVAYGFMSGTEPEHRKNGAGTIGYWEGIKYASKFANELNFQGSVVKGIEKYLQAFGGYLTPYYQIRKIKTKGQLFKQTLKKLAKFT